MRKNYSIYKRKLKTDDFFYIRFWLREEARFSPARSAGSIANTLIAIQEAERIKNPKSEQARNTKEYKPHIKTGAQNIAEEVISRGGWYEFQEKERKLQAIAEAELKAKTETETACPMFTLKNAGSKKVIPFLLVFWDYEKSPYVAEKKDYNQTISPLYCRNLKRAVELHLSKIIPKNTVIDDLTNQALKNIQQEARKQHAQGSRSTGRLSDTAVNAIMSAITIPLRWLLDNEAITRNPVKIKKYTATPEQVKKPLTREEAGRLFSSKWDDERGKLAAVFAYYTGARLGEVAALYIDDIRKTKSGTWLATIQASWNELSGRKGTKTDNIREVPIPGKLALDLIALHKKNPNGSHFIFWDALSVEKPFSRKQIADALLRQLRKIGITDAERKIRSLTFHSFRHGFNSELRNRLPDATLRKVTGHASQQMTDHYDHLTETAIQDIQQAQKDVLLPYNG